MAITTLSMVLTVMVLNLHSVTERPVPYWVRIILLHHLSRIFCLGPINRKDDKPNEYCNNHVRKKRKMIGRKSVTMIEVNDIDEHVPIIAINGSVASSQGETSFVHMARPSYANITASNNNEISSSDNDNDKPDYSKDWHQLAEVVDRLFFWTFLIAIVAISILLFHPLTKDYLIRRPSMDK